MASTSIFLHKNDSFIIVDIMSDYSSKVLGCKLKFIFITENIPSTSDVNIWLNVRNMKGILIDNVLIKFWDANCLILKY